MHLASDKIQNICLLLTSATLANLCGGYCASLCLPTALKLESSMRQSRNGQLLQYGHAYQLNDRMNVKTTDMRMHVLRNRVKRETVAPQNDRATEQNVNFIKLTSSLLAYLDLHLPIKVWARLPSLRQLPGHCNQRSNHAWRRYSCAHAHHPHNTSRNLFTRDTLTCTCICKILHARTQIHIHVPAQLMLKLQVAGATCVQYFKKVCGDEMTCWLCWTEEGGP